MLELTGQLRETEKSRVRRGRIRASYERDLAYQIIDQSLVSQLGMIIDGLPFVQPVSHWRSGDRIYWHGATKGRMIKGVINRPVCLTFVLVDGLVLARSAIHHSVNYRSAMLFGEPELITDPAEKEKQLEIFINRYVADRWSTLRPMHQNELKATGILSMPIDEGSVKMRAQPPVDDEEDYQWPVWAGVLPLHNQWGEVQPCPRLEGDYPAPDKLCQI